MNVMKSCSLGEVVGTTMSDFAGSANGVENERLALLVFTAA